MIIYSNIFKYIHKLAEVRNISEESLINEILTQRVAYFKRYYSEFLRTLIFKIRTY
ncbi:MAG: hypothetical protein LBM96_00145 [Methanobrevibacter sp.]|jgi:hypothetical protein|nr:hypothetical protein [Candidatus Methanoflexus mossambicus]